MRSERTGRSGQRRRRRRERREEDLKKEKVSRGEEQDKDIRYGIISSV